MSLQRWVLALVLGVGFSFATAQTQAKEEAQNVVQFSAAASVEANQDLLSIALTATREGSDANAVQTQLKQALDAALNAVKPAAAPGKMEVRSGNFNVSPRFGKDGKITTWQGNVELILEGKDFALITASAAKASTLTIGRVGFGLSREERNRSENEVQTLAIERFKAKAAEITRNFGFKNYGLREVSISGDNYGPQPRMMAMQAKSGLLSASSDTPLSVEPGKTTVQVTVSGSVQMR